MVKRSITLRFCTLLTAMLCIACGKEDDPETRGFYMGFTPFPYDISEDAVNYVYAKLESDADIINHHFDNGVPWEEALSGEPFPQNILDDWNFRKASTSPSHKIYLSVTPLNYSRTGLAANRGEVDNMPLPEAWAASKFSDDNVKQAYLNYCKRSIEFFEPDYFNMAIEANLLYVNSPTLWSEYLDLHAYVYGQLKASYPNLPVFTSVAGGYLIKDFIQGNDHVIQKLAVLQLLDYSDFYGISFYPYLSDYLGNAYPENVFDELFYISEKPLVVAETGYVAQSFSIQIGSTLVTIQSDQLKQQKFTKDLLDACERRSTEFVINFVLRDYDQLWVKIGSPNDVNIAWRDSGLYDENGNARLASATWKDFFSKKYQRN